MRKVWAKTGAIALAILACAGCDAGRLRGGHDSSTPSGFPVPRYVSLNFAEVRSRAGPSEDHRIVSVYRARGLPVQVVAETEDWRRICDPEGGLAWVKKNQVDGRRTVIRIQPGPLALHKRPQADAPISGYLPYRATASFGKCARGWCKVGSGAVAGWTPESEIWGADPRPQCHG